MTTEGEDDGWPEFEDALYKVVLKRRRAFYAEAVKQGIITSEQRIHLLALHVLRDAKQRARDREILERDPQD